MGRAKNKQGHTLCNDDLGKSDDLQRSNINNNEEINKLLLWPEGQTKRGSSDGRAMAGFNGQAGVRLAAKEGRRKGWGCSGGVEEGMVSARFP